jgi:nicotinamidase-related amidase
MPLTTLDPVAALIVIDLQQGIVGLETLTPAAEIVARSAQLARAFRHRGLPVVLVNVTAAAPGRTQAVRFRPAFPDGWDQLVPELDPQPSDYLISKQRVGAFIGTGLNDILRKHGVTQVFLTGIATSSGVEATARSAHDHGYNVVFVADAITDRVAEAHAYSMDKVFPRLGEIDTTANILQALAP